MPFAGVPGKLAPVMPVNEAVPSSRTVMRAVSVDAVRFAKLHLPAGPVADIDPAIGWSGETTAELKVSIPCRCGNSQRSGDLRE